MTTGPIEFARTPSQDNLGETEYGGGPGLIQHGPNGEHLERLTTDERRGILRRAGSSVRVDRTVDEDGAVTEVHTVIAEGIDPVTGLTLENADAEVATETTKPVL